jgi:hypothetical protein
MEKKRLVVMNGHCITQVAAADDKWRDIKIEKARGRPPGLYNLHSATPVDPKQSLYGVVAYVDESHVYQRVGKSMVKHEVASFDKVPDIGFAGTLSYSEGRAVAVSAQELQRSRKI